MDWSVREWGPSKARAGTANRDPDQSPSASARDS